MQKVKVVVFNFLACLTLSFSALAELPDIALKTIDGAKSNLRRYNGQVLMIVNTATKCGYTPQLKELQEIHQTHQGRGFVVLGFPSNDFGGQAPESNAEIKAFCANRFKASFPMFEKGPVLGNDKQPLFGYLTSSGSGALQGEIEWNFEKFLLDREGLVRYRFGSHVNPLNKKIRDAIEELLSEKARG